MHRLLPVHPVAISDQHRNWCARRLSTAYTGEDFGAVALDGHSAAAAVATLAAAELRVERIDVDIETSGHPVKRDHQRLSVRFAPAQKPQHSQGIVYEEFAHSRRRAAVFPHVGGASLLAFRHGHGAT